MLHELRRAGFEPRWQHVATEPDFLARLAPPPDIILTDYTLPQFDALRALRCVQERAPELHAGGPGRAALPCGHEGGVLSGAEVEGGGEQGHGVFVRTDLEAALEVADGACAEARLAGQGFLGQAGSLAVAFAHRATGREM